MPVEGRRRARHRAAAALALLAASLTASGAASAEPRPQTLAACAACHGADGNSPVAQIPSLAGQPRVFIENQLVLIREGLRDIPAMKPVMSGIDDEEIVALAKHFAAQPVRPQATAAQPDKLREGARLAERLMCGTCHLASYAGQNQVPRLAGQNEAYLLAAMIQFRDHPGLGRDTIMAATLRGLADAELDRLAHYLAGFR